jgi:hypothetical protein
MASAEGLEPVSPAKKAGAIESTAEDQSPGELINASGHRQELDRNFSLLSICAVAVTTGNTWIAQGGSVVTALSNGGPSGVIYELYGDIDYRYLLRRR